MYKHTETKGGLYVRCEDVNWYSIFSPVILIVHKLKTIENEMTSYFLKFVKARWLKIHLHIYKQRALTLVILQRKCVAKGIKQEEKLDE